MYNYNIVELSEEKFSEKIVSLKNSTKRLAFLFYLKKELTRILPYFEMIWEDISISSKHKINSECPEIKQYWAYKYGKHYKYFEDSLEQLNHDRYFQVKKIKRMLSRIENEITFYTFLLNKVESTEQTNNLINFDYNKIVWLKNKQDLVALFDKLEALGFISYQKQKDKILANHFTWKDGIINPPSLKHLRNNIVNKGETHQISDELKELFSELSSENK